MMRGKVESRGWYHLAPVVLIKQRTARENVEQTLMFHRSGWALWKLQKSFSLALSLLPFLSLSRLGFMRPLSTFICPICKITESTSEGSRWKGENNRPESTSLLSSFVFPRSLSIFLPYRPFFVFNSHTFFRATRSNAAWDFLLVSPTLVNFSRTIATKVFQEWFYARVLFLPRFSLPFPLFLFLSVTERFWAEKSAESDAEK